MATEVIIYLLEQMGWEVKDSVSPGIVRCRYQGSEAHSFYLQRSKFHNTSREVELVFATAYLYMQQYQQAHPVPPPLPEAVLPEEW